MPKLLGKHGSYPPERGWDMRKVRQLAFTDWETMDEDENEYLSMWLQTTPQGQVIQLLAEWEEADSRSKDRVAADQRALDERPVGKALFYTEDDLKNGRINPDDLAR